MSKIVVALALVAVALANPLSAQQVIQETKLQEGGVLYITSGAGMADYGEIVLNFSPVPTAFGSSTSMLRNPQVQRDLELMEDQLQQLRDLQASFSERIAELRRPRTPGTAKLDGESLKKAIKQTQEEQRKRMEDVLLPHQLERLKQVALQMKMKSRGDMETLTDQEISDELNISDEQKERIKKRAEVIKREMEQEIARAKERAKQKLLRELTPQQRKQLDKMLGTEFDNSPVVKKGEPKGDRR